MATKTTDFDRVMDFWDVVDTWSYHDSPNARAYRLLEDLDLGPQLTGAEAVGEINFIDGACPGVDYLGVASPDATRHRAVAEAAE